MSEFEHLMSPEDLETLHAASLIVRIHDQLETALEFQNDLLNAHVRAQQPNDAMNVVIISTKGSDSAPVQHDRIIFGPKLREQPIEDIDFVVARIPVPDEDFNTTNFRQGLRWNDIFLQIWDTKGVAQDYLLNSKGLVPFDSKDDISPDPNYEQTEDLFTIDYPAEPTQDITLASLDQVLQEYVFHPQSNDEEPPFYFRSTAS